MRPLFQKSFVAALAAAAILVAADQYTKWLSHKLIPPGGQVNVLSFFGFVNVINRGPHSEASKTLAIFRS